jgi:Arc/MetJ-type ribon-helix-helix transcriptional regulator
VPLTVRLSLKTERALNALAKRQRQSRSDIVREALARYEATTADVDAGASRPYDAWVDVIGVIAGGVRHRTRTTGEQSTDILRKRARARRATPPGGMHRRPTW